MMKKFMPFVVLCVAATPALALTPAGQGRRTMNAQMATPRATASVNQINAMASMASMKVNQPVTGTAPGNNDNNNNSGNNNTGNNSGTTPAPSEPSTPAEEEKDKREKEKAACINNNIGIGNTFVWASRYSNINNYASMVEDVDEPANNTCFVKVEMKSDDAKISVADIPAKYFEMGQTITCGDWADEDALEKRILDAKKSARTWGTVGGAVGGAALGVGAMELFGNKLIGGAVEGQKGLNDNERLYSQLAVLKKNQDPRFNQIMAQLKSLQRECEDKIWQGAAEPPKECTNINYSYLLTLDSAL